MTTAQESQKRLHACMSLFIASGDEVRLSIVGILTEKVPGSRQTPGPTHSEQYGLNANEITRRINLSRPVISHHLKILEEAGIVGARQEGTANYYYLTLRESSRRLMELGHGLEEFLY